MLIIHCVSIALFIITAENIILQRCHSTVLINVVTIFVLRTIYYQNSLFTILSISLHYIELILLSVSNLVTRSDEEAWVSKFHESQDLSGNINLSSPKDGNATFISTWNPAAYRETFFDALPTQELLCNTIYNNNTHESI